jgi:DNA processing protein
VDSAASAGCLELIRKGARIVRNADDVIEDLKGISVADFGLLARENKASGGGKQGEPPVRETKENEGENNRGLTPPARQETPPLPPLDPAQQRVYDALAAKRHADELVRELAISAGDLARTLMQLELKKIVRRLPGNFYERR